MFAMGSENLRPLFIVASLLTFFVNLQFSSESDSMGSGVGVGIMLDSGDVSLMNESESPISDANSVSLNAKSFSLSRFDGFAFVGEVCCFDTVRLMSSPLPLVVVSLLMIYTLEFSVNFPFSRVMTLRTGEFCTKILVLGILLSLVVVTCSVIELFEFELGIPMPSGGLPSTGNSSHRFVVDGVVVVAVDFMRHGESSVSFDLAS